VSIHSANVESKIILIYTYTTHINVEVVVVVVVVVVVDSNIHLLKDIVFESTQVIPDIGLVQNDIPRGL